MPAAARKEPSTHRSPRPIASRLSVITSGKLPISVSGDIDQSVTDAEIQLVFACLGDKLADILGVT
jgi:hypothetical protein